MTTLRSNGPPGLELYFAFPDGALHYVCAECPMNCCRRSGAFGGSLRREMPALLTLYPALGTATTGRRGDVLTFANPSDGCYFIDDDNLCRIEKLHGKALKPAGCVLFPFNVFRRIGSTVAVSPQFHCTLRIQAPPRPGHVHGTHAVLEAATKDSRFLDPGYIASMAPIRLGGSETPHSVLAREIAFRDLCGRALGRCCFTSTLRQASRDPGALDAFLVRAAPLLELAPQSPGGGKRDELDDLLLAMAPALRLEMLHLSPEAILRGLALGESLLRRALSLSHGPATPRGTHDVLTSMGPALRLLARGDEPLPVAPGTRVKVPPFGQPDLTFVTYDVLKAGANGAGALDVLEHALKALPASFDRSALLVQLGTRLDRPTPPTRIASSPTLAASAP